MIGDGRATGGLVAKVEGVPWSYRGGSGYSAAPFNQAQLVFAQLRTGKVILLVLVFHGDQSFSLSSPKTIEAAPLGRASKYRALRCCVARCPLGSR